MKKYIVTIAIICIFLILSFVGYYVYSKTDSISEEDLLKNKASEELDYLDNSIISMLNSFNQISYTNYKIIEKELPNDNSKSESESEDEPQQGESKNNGNSSNTVTDMSSVPNSILINRRYRTKLE